MVNAFRKSGVGVHTTHRSASHTSSKAGPSTGRLGPRVFASSRHVKVGFDSVQRRYARAEMSQKGLGSPSPLWYTLFAFVALVSPLVRERSGRKVTLAAFFYAAKAAKL